MVYQVRQIPYRYEKNHSCRQCSHKSHGRTWLMLCQDIRVKPFELHFFLQLGGSVTESFLGLDYILCYSLSKLRNNDSTLLSDVTIWSHSRSYGGLQEAIPQGSSFNPISVYLTQGIASRVSLAAFIAKDDISSGIRHCVPQTTGQRETTERKVVNNSLTLFATYCCLEDIYRLWLCLLESWF